MEGNLCPDPKEVRNLIKSHPAEEHGQLSETQASTPVQSRATPLTITKAEPEARSHLTEEKPSGLARTWRRGDPAATWGMRTVVLRGSGGTGCWLQCLRDLCPCTRVTAPTRVTGAQAAQGSLGGAGGRQCKGESLSITNNEILPSARAHRTASCHVERNKPDTDHKNTVCSLSHVGVKKIKHQSM